MIGSRVTHHTLVDAATRNLQTSLARSQKLTEQITSGKRIQRPSDDATGTITAIQQRTEKRALQQHMRNADDGIGWLSTADSALQAAVATLRTAYTKTVQGANSETNGTLANDALASEIEELRDTILAIGNTQYAGRPVFGGTNGDAVPFAANGVYNGGAGAVNRQVSTSATIKVNTNGDIAFGNFYKVLTDTATEVRNGNHAGAQAGIENILAVQETMTSALADIGARHARLEDVKNRGSHTKYALQENLAKIESIDLAESIMQLQLQEVAHKAALGATAKAMQPTLLDFLR